ncbi:cation transporter permease [Leptolyngbya sp. 'hensonii']|nr:cation transporter permease [Leptolyngbya sp. 'hensonii']
MTEKGADQTQKIRSLRHVLVLLSLFFCVELGAGIWSHSLSLLADAEHLLSDLAALGIALGAAWLSRFASRWQVLHRLRLETMAALINGMSLAGVAFWIVQEAMARFQTPSPEILGLPMLVTALVGLLINSINVACLHGCSHQDLSTKGAFFHVLSDVISSVGTVLAAIAVIWLDWSWADGVISLMVAGLIALFSAYLVVQCVSCLLGYRSDTSVSLCHCPTGTAAYDRQQAEKLLFPSLTDIV